MEAAVKTQAPTPMSDDPLSQDSAPPVEATSVRGAASVLGDLATIGSSRMAAAVLSLATALITTRMLGPSGYGTIALVGIVAMLVFTVSTAWTGISVRRYGRENLEAIGNMKCLTWNRALIGAPLLAICIATVAILKSVGAMPPGMTWALILIALATGVVNIVTDHWYCLLETSGQMKISAIGRIASQAAYVAALVAIVAAGGRASVQSVLLLALASAALFALSAAPFVWKEGVGSPTFDQYLLRRMLWLSTPMIALMASQYVFGSVDVVVLRMFRSQSDVGIYAVAYQAYTVLSAAGVTATAVLVPLFVSLRVAGRSNVIDRYFRASVPQGLFAISVVCGLGAVPVPVLVPIVFGQQFAAAAVPMMVLLAGLAFLFASYLIAPILTLHEKTRATAAINVVAGIINVVADFLLIGLMHMGVLAPAIATSGALLFVFGAFYAKARTTLGSKAVPNPLMLAPLPAGIVPAALLQGVQGVAAGFVGVALAAAGILLCSAPFEARDAEIVAKLDLPDAVKRVAVKGILRVSSSRKTVSEQVV